MKMMTIQAVCKACGRKFSRNMPKDLVDAATKAGAAGFTGTCPRCKDTTARVQ
jgi:uncharacterized protein (DUF983 family)